jgi:hypothetical protein
MRLQFVHPDHDVAARSGVMQTPQDRGQQPELLLRRRVDVTHLGRVVVVRGECRQPHLPVVIDHKDRWLERMPDNEPMVHLHGGFPMLSYD